MMKAIQTVKTSLFTLMLTFFAIGAFANEKEVVKKENVNVVEKVTPSKVQTDFWYFQGSSSTNLTSSSLYDLNPLTGKPCGSTPQVVCRIEAPEDPNNPGYPDMEYQDENGISVAQHILNAQSSLSGTPQTNSVVKAFRSY